MIRGIGVDAVRISKISPMLDDGSGMLNSAFVKYTFSEREIAEITGQPAEYLAARFAVKEAVFKAIAHSLPQKTFDLRSVESSHNEDGSPYVLLSAQMTELMKKVNVTALHLSVTTEGDYAIAFVVAEG